MSVEQYLKECKFLCLASTGFGCGLMTMSSSCRVLDGKIVMNSLKNHYIPAKSISRREVAVFAYRRDKVEGESSASEMKSFEMNDMLEIMRKKCKNVSNSSIFKQ